MSILIRQARIVSPDSPFHNRVADILVDGGKIVSIKKNIQARNSPRILEGLDLHVSPGWIDMQAVSCDPGYEHRETLDSVLRAAASGGFTGICLHSVNQPPLHNKAQIEYLLNRAQNRVVEVLPFGTVTMDAKGRDLSEMYDMKQSGAVAFSDHKQVLADAGTVMRALQYSNNVGSFIVAHCNDGSISRGGQMNEGETSTSLGLKGIPALAEELMLERNLSVLEYAGGRLHIPTISTRGSVELIKKAKANGLQVTCGVAAINLLLDDSVLQDFDTNFKLDPPLRSKKDVQALRNAVENGIIDVIVSDHLPQDPESKELEFDLADVGMINLQTAFCCALEAMRGTSVESIIRSLAVNPRRILGMEEITVAEEQDANLTVFSLTETTTLSEKNNESRSKNSAFWGKTLQGSVLGVIRGSRTWFNS